MLRYMIIKSLRDLSELRELWELHLVSLIQWKGALKRSRYNLLVSTEWQPIHSKSANICGVCFSV